jgi:hypothetical protein
VYPAKRFTTDFPVSGFGEGHRAAAGGLEQRKSARGYPFLLVGYDIDRGGD